MSGRVLNNNTELLIDSRYRDVSTTINNFTYTIDSPIDKIYDNICLISAYIIKSWYLCDSSRNNSTFIFYEGPDMGFFKMPDGNYDLINFIPIVTNLLNTNSPNGWIYSISYPSPMQVQTGLWTFLVSNNTSQPIFDFTKSISSGLYFIFGFDQNMTYQFIGNSLTSTRPFRLDYTRYVTIRSNNLREPGIAGDNSLLASISATNIPFGNALEYTTYSIESSSKLLSSAPGSNSFNFTLWDEFDNLLDTNGINYQFTIMLYKYNNSSDLVINDLEIRYADYPEKQALLERDPTER